MPRKAPLPIAKSARDNECAAESVSSSRVSLGRLVGRTLGDWREGKRGRALARWGYLRPPQTRGRVIWVLSGADYASVRLGVETVRAIRQKRLDVRIVFTFAEEFPALLEPLHECAKTGWGFAPDDYPRAWRRAVERIDPFAMIWVGAAPEKSATEAAASVAHRVILNGCGNGIEGFEFGFPASDAQANSLCAIPQSPVCDFGSLLANANVDPNFASAVNGGNDRRLWWLHSADADSIDAFDERFRRAFPADLLFVSGCAGAPAHARAAMSTWNREPLPAGMVWIDEAKWFPAVAAACEAVHFEAMAGDVFWQAMAGGLPVTRARRVVLPKAALTSAIASIESHTDLIAHWQGAIEAPLTARRHADMMRRLFWEERRLAAELNEAFLQRVFDW